MTEKCALKSGLFPGSISNAMEWHKSNNDQIYNLFSLYGINILIVVKTIKRDSFWIYYTEKLDDC